jgi:outer membrane protein
MLLNQKQHGCFTHLSQKLVHHRTFNAMLAKYVLLLSLTCLVLPIAAEERTSDHTGTHHYRLLGGYFIDTKLKEILAGDVEVDDRHTGIVGLEYGYRFLHRAFDWPVDLTAKVGFIRHLERDLQDDFNQYTLAVKAYFYGFPWQHHVRTRLGLAQGLSYVEKIPSIEYESLVRDRQLNTSHLMNHLDLSLDINAGDLLNWSALMPCYVGGGIYHRSGVFGEVGLFNHVDGGSNYLYMHLACVH